MCECDRKYIPHGFHKIVSSVKVLWQNVSKETAETPVTENVTSQDMLQNELQD